MEKETEEEKPQQYRVKDLFDKVLGQHMERLLGTKHGIEGVPVTLLTISCLVLLAERETEIESDPSDPPERFTRETLIDELVEMGLDKDEDMNVALEDLIRKGYIEVEDGGKFLAKRPALSMAQLLDRIFPKTPGMNLVAYFIQMIDEVESDRKELKLALGQFNQTMQAHGVPMKKEPPPPKQKKRPRRSSALIQSGTPRSDPSIKRNQPIVQKESLSLSDFYTPMQTETRVSDAPVPSSGPENLSSSGDSSQLDTGEVDIREVSIDQDESTETSPEMDEAIETQEPDMPEEEKDEKPAEEPEISAETPPSQASGPGSEEEETDPSTKSIQTEQDLSGAETKDESDIDSAEEMFDETEEYVERQISTFAESLAMKCPLCKTGEIHTKKTAKGKVFYRCLNIDCNLISWEKPYHFVCPQCKNPFLVESSDKLGRNILKCPRATCRYWQEFPGEETNMPQANAVASSLESKESTPATRKPRKRRVVRKRLVRRKR